MRLYTNRDAKFVGNAFRGHTNARLYFASPFFSDAGVIEELLATGCTVRLIVRLSERTSPSALRSLLPHPSVQVRWFNREDFHAKLYIFGTQFALIGSANLTKAALLSNRRFGRSPRRYGRLR